MIIKSFRINKLLTSKEWNYSDSPLYTRHGIYHVDVLLMYASQDAYGPMRHIL